MGKLDSLRRLAALGCIGALVAVGCATALPDEDECAVGTEGCGCTLGGGCDPGLACLSKLCVDPAGSVASSGGGGAPTTGSSVAGTTGSSVAGSTNAATTTGATNGPSSTAGVGSTTAAATSSTGSGTCSVPDPTNVMGCNSCGACDAWDVSWSPVVGATHYRVKFLCAGTHESPNILDTNAELCYEVGMCSYCSGGIGGMWVEACNGTCCSAGAPVPESQAPLGCQVDCCL